MRVVDRRVAAPPPSVRRACTEDTGGFVPGECGRLPVSTPAGTPFRAIGSPPSLLRLQQRQVRGQAGEQVWRAGAGGERDSFGRVLTHSKIASFVVV